MTTFIQNPQVKDCLHVEVLTNEKVFLLSENASWLLAGKTYPHLVPLLTGEHTAGELVQKLSGVVSPAEVHYALHQLAANGYVVEAEPEILSSNSANQIAFWHALGIDATTARQRLAQTRVRITCLGYDQPSYFQHALSELGVATDLQGECANEFEVVLVDDYMQPGLAEINRRHVRENTPWMMVKLIGQLAWIGPIFRPGVTGCWECLSQRLIPNRQLETYIQSKAGKTAPLPTSRAHLASTIAMGAQWAATEVLKWILQGKNDALEGQIITLDTVNANTRQHVLVRRPQCAACGDPGAYKKPRAITLTPSKKQYSNDGGHRTITPDETYQRYSHLISPITGVVTWMQDITEDGKGLSYSYIAGHNFANVQNNVRWLQDNLRSRAGGKGMSDIQAKVSAIGESIERYSGVYRGDEYVERASFKAMGQKAIHINDVLRISDKQYANRYAWNKQQSLDQFHLVPEPFNLNLEIDWSPAWSLTNHEFKWLPSALCYYGHPECRQHFFCMSDSNGASAGNTMEEAVLQGFLELVERDSVAVWWYNRIQRPEVDLASFKMPYLKALGEFYQELGREMWVIDITADLGIPTFAAISRRKHAVEDIIIGFGAHLDAKVALMRAVTELNQFLPAVMKYGADGKTLYNFPHGLAFEWWQKARLADQPHLVPHPALTTKTFDDYPAWGSTDLKDDVERCVAIAAAANVEVLALDQTRPDIGMQVCHMFAPGLRHFWRRLGTGRLYDVPVKLGWLDQPTDESNLNPWSLFF